MLLTFAAPIKFNLVLKYIDSCLLYARGFFDTSFPRQKYVFAPTLFYCVFFHCYLDIHDQKYAAANY